MNAPPDVAILIPLPEEAAPLLRRLETNGSEADGEVEGAHRGRLSGVDVVVAVTGDGPIHARATTERIVEAFRPRSVVVAGVAGALSEGLEVGTKVLAADVGREGGEVHRTPEPRLAELARAADARIGTAFTARRLAASVDDKVRLRRLAIEGGGAEPAVVDLESASCVAVADRVGVPWLVLRAVSDRADEALPEFLERCRGPDGRIVREEVVRQALRRPRVLPRLYALQKAVESCANDLAGALEGLVATWRREEEDPRSRAIRSTEP